MLNISGTVYLFLKQRTCFIYGKLLKLFKNVSRLTIIVVTESFFYICTYIQIILNFSEFNAKLHLQKYKDNFKK